MGNCKAARLLAVSAALVLIPPLSAPAGDHATRQVPRRGVGAHPAIAAQALLDAQKARLAAAMARLDGVCAPLQMARAALMTALQAMLEQREDSLQMQQQRLREQRSAAVKRQAGVAAHGDPSGSGSADEKEQLADIDGALATFARARTRTRKEYESLIDALQSGDAPAAGTAEARRSLSEALGSLGGRISRLIGAGTYRRIRRSAETRALSCYNAHWEQIGLVSADGKQCRLPSLGSLRPQFFDSECSYDPKHR